MNAVEIEAAVSDLALQPFDAEESRFKTLKYRPDFPSRSWYANMRRRQALRAIPGIGAALGFAPWSKAKAGRKVVAGEYPLVANAVLEKDIVRQFLPNAPDYAGDR